MNCSPILSNYLKSYYYEFFPHFTNDVKTITIPDLLLQELRDSSNKPQSFHPGSTGAWGSNPNRELERHPLLPLPYRWLCQRGAARLYERDRTSRRSRLRLLWDYSSVTHVKRKHIIGLQLMFLPSSWKPSVPQNQYRRLWKLTTLDFISMTESWELLEY